MENKENRFKGDSKLSNFYECPVYFDNRQYNSSEAVYQSFKTKNQSLRNKFIGIDPDHARRLGRKIQKTEYVSKTWEIDKIQVMIDAVRAKMLQNPECMQELLNTSDDYLIEDTTGWHDRIWGKCYCSKCNGTGDNYLGQILMLLREEFRNSKA